jgi:hypothetical protein
MAEFEHLPLPRALVRTDRRKQQAPVEKPKRNASKHAVHIEQQTAAVIERSKTQKHIEGVDPSLIMKVRMKSTAAHDEWARAGFSLLATDSDKSLVLFNSDPELKEFFRRLNLYRQGKPPELKDARYSSLFAFIEEVLPLEPADRIGPRFRKEDVGRPENLLVTKQYTCDVELWDPGSRQGRKWYVDKLRAEVVKLGGSVPSFTYAFGSLLLLRVRCTGHVLRQLLEIVEIRSIDLPPQADLAQDDLADKSIRNFDDPGPPPDNAPRIGLIDTGMSRNPLLAPAIAMSIGVPEKLGFADGYGHGTKVGAICVYGDVGASAAANAFQPAFWLCSVKVTNDQGQFDPDLLVHEQMRLAIGELAEAGCRIINISLGDRRAVFSDGRASTWTAALDELARKLNLLIVISAGNGRPAVGEAIERAISDYPKYLRQPDNRIVEPATAACALTVGAIAHGNGLPDIAEDMVNIRPITSPDQPAPFTRTGPGINGMTKPDLVDYGGTLVFDGAIPRLASGRDWASAGVTTLSAKYLDGLFTHASGTSYAAPLVAYKAALLLRRFPDASANLLRVLLATAADVPNSASSVFDDEKQTRDACGHGLSDVLKALTSEERRVILYTEDKLAIDQFAVYELPMLKEFRETKGIRRVRVALAFDPPVRHTRAEYLGIDMNFRLVRGLKLEEVIEHFRKRSKEEGKVPKINRNLCPLEPGPATRDVCTLQIAALQTERRIKEYGDPYFLVVRCEGGWAADRVEFQKYALTVEFQHEGQIQLHQRLQQRLRLRA